MSDYTRETVPPKRGRSLIEEAASLAKPILLATRLAPQTRGPQIRTFNIAPSWTRLLSTNAVFTFGGFVRHDQYNY